MLSLSHNEAEAMHMQIVANILYSTLILASSANAAHASTVTLLGPKGTYATQVHSLSHHGDIASGSSSDSRGRNTTSFYWRNGIRVDNSQNMKLLHMSSNGRYATGSTNVLPTNRIFRADEGFNVENLGQPGGSTTQAAGRGLSYGGDHIIFAVRNPTTFDTTAYRWSQSGGAVNIGHLYASSGNTIPHGISYDGNMIVGESDPGSFLNPGYAFYWTPQTGMRELAMPAGSGREESGASGVSGNGQVIFGWAPSPLRGVIWRDLVPEWMPILAGGWQGYRSLSIDESGDTAILQVGNIQLQLNANVIYTRTDGIMFAPEFFAMHGITFPETGRLTINCVSGNGLTFAGSYFDPILGVPTQGIIITIPAPSSLFILLPCLVCHRRRR